MDEPILDDEETKVPGVWVGVDALPILYANQFVLQHFRDEAFLIVGGVSPPILLGEAEDRVEQLRSIEFVPIQAYGRFALSLKSVRELYDILGQQLDMLRRAADEGDEE